MATLRKARNLWYARISYKKDGKPAEKLIPLHTKQRAKAERLLPEIKNQEKAYKAGVIELNEIGLRDIPKIQPLIDSYIDYLELNNRSQKTIVMYNFSLGIFANIFKGQDITLLSKADYKPFLQALKKCYTNLNSLNIVLRNTRAFLRWCIENNHLKKLPFKIKQFSIQKKKPKYFNDFEMEKILNQAKPDNELYCRIYVHWKTGLRLREFKNSYLENGFINTFNPCKNGQERTIPVDQKTAYFYNWLKENGKHIPNTISKKFLDILRELNLYKTKSGDTRHFHNLRHTFAVRTYYQCKDIYKVKTLLGHSSVTTTEIYATFNIDKIAGDFQLNEKPPEALKQVIDTKPLLNFNNNSSNEFTQFESILNAEINKKYVS